ncbi:MAG: DUF1566 domain-containing protein [Sphingobacteriales bacterium]|nr:MAG: DUF1566 domain-containing protein [Sphingobacteriales bacterium]
MANANYPASDVSGIQGQNILVGYAVAGVAGSMVASSANCSSNDETSCVSTAAFGPVANGLLTPGTLKQGVTIGSVIGAYPSVSYRLSGATAMADLTSFTSQIKSSLAFEWFDGSGNRHQGNGNDLLIANNIVSPATIFGIGGTASVVVSPPGSCSAGNQSNCLTTSTYRALEQAKLVPFNLKARTSLHGVNGAIKLCLNGVNLGAYDNQTFPAGSGSDIYDTLPGFNAYLNSAADNPFDSLGLDVCDGAEFTESMAGGTNCTSHSSDCALKDRITGLVWSRQLVHADPMLDGFTYTEALAKCDTLTLGGSSDWRLPTFKESLQYYIDNIRNVIEGSAVYGAAWGNGAFYNHIWSSTSNPNDSNVAYATLPHLGAIDVFSKSTRLRINCVHN